MQVVDSQPKSKMWYRINATRNMTGGRKIQPNQKMNDKMKEVGSQKLCKSPVLSTTEQADPHVVNNVGLNIRVFIMAAVPANSRLGLNIAD